MPNSQELMPSTLNFCSDSSTLNGYAKLSAYAWIRAKGADAEKFLQGQLSADVAALAPGEWSWAAHCNPKGRMISNFIVWREEKDNFLLRLRANLSDIAMAALKKYAVFSKVELSIDDSLQAVAAFGGAPAPSDSLAQIRISAAAVEHWMKQNDSELSPIVDARQWPLHLLQSGLIELEADQSEQFLPQELRLEAIGGVSFKKGCYNGQEVVARLHYRGQLKKGLYRAECDQSHVEVGLNIELGGQKIGEIVAFSPAPDERVEILILANHDAVENTSCHIQNGGKFIRWLPFAYAIPKGT